MNAARDVTDLDGNVIHVYAQSETTYGEPAGLFGINCKHYPSPFIPGVSVIRGEPQNPEENAKAYAESQQQRGLERKIREEKRDLMMMKAQGAPDEMIKAQRAKIRKTDDDIDAFCAETGRARRQNREGVYTKRDFPDAKTYDVTQFTNEQKERIERYYREGGEQQGFKFGQMTPNEPLVPNTPVIPNTPVPAPPVVPPATPVPQNVAPQATPTETNAVQSSAGENSNLVKHLEASSVQTRPVERFETPLTEKEIIDRVGGADQTKGSCASLAWTYAGNKNGLDVLDFRDGASRVLFSNRNTSFMVTELDGVVSKVVESGNDIKAVHELLKETVEGREYFMATGHHAAIIRKVGTGHEYLELQSATNNGWHTLNDDMLRWRFDCKRSHSTYGMKYTLKNILIDIGSLNGNKDFETMLEYINTAADAQRKGIGGGIK